MTAIWVACPSPRQTTHARLRSAPVRAFAVLCLLAAPALAKPWQGIAPGVSKKADVTKKLGNPTKTQTEKGKEILVYTGVQAPSGTRQAQVKLDDKGVVERIDVYPGVGLLREDIETSYGGWCNADEPTDPCYEKKNATNRDYWLYQELGVAVFFTGEKVEQLVFLPSKKKKAEKPQESEEE